MVICWLSTPWTNKLCIFSQKPAPKTISSIIVMEEISFEKFAGKHGASTQQLNALNGLTLKDSTVLAKGSELYVPGR